MKRYQSTRLTVDDQSRIMSRLGVYFGRHTKTLTPPPVEPIRKLIRARTPTDQLRIWDAVQELWFAAPEDAHVDDDDTNPIRMITGFEDTGIHVQLEDGLRLMIQIPQHFLTTNRIPYWLDPEQCREMHEPMSLRLILGGDTDEFEHWTRSTAEVMERVHRSYDVLSSVVTMASTGGQLHRMCPDLMKYVDYDMKESLSHQQRRSPLPPSWMEVDRYDLKDALDHLSLCHLLPILDGEDTRQFWRAEKQNFQQYALNDATAFGRESLGLGSWHVAKWLGGSFHRERLSKFTRDGWTTPSYE